MGALTDGELLDGKYKIVRFLGSGAWASVYEGVNARIGRRVAIKVLSDEAMLKPGIVDRFEREAQAATRIDSEHVVHVFDLGVLPDGKPYLVMELLEGHDLAHEIATAGPLTQRRAVFLVVQALRGLGEAHTAGVLHRDVKPDNIVLVKTKHGAEVVKIVDFGISKLHSGLQVSSMTATNSILGSPVYMSPEQCRGTKHMDQRSDLYSLGVVLYELLTTKLPHKAETFNELMFKIALEDIEPPIQARPDLDPALCAILQKALARETRDRFQTAADFEHALIHWAETKGLEPSDWFARRSTARVVGGTDDPAVGLRQTTLRPPDGTPDPSLPPLPAGAKTFDRTTTSGSEKAVPVKAGSGPQGWVLASVGAVVAIAVAGFFFARGRPSPRVSTSDAPLTSSIAVAPVAADEVTASAAPTTNVAAPASASAGSSAQLAHPEPTTTAAPASAPNGRGSFRARAAQPPVAATPSASPPVSAAAAPAASVPKSVVDGRRIRTDF